MSWFGLQMFILQQLQLNLHQRAFARLLKSFSLVKLNHQSIYLTFVFLVCVSIVSSQIIQELVSVRTFKYLHFYLQYCTLKLGLTSSTQQYALQQCCFFILISSVDHQPVTILTFCLGNTALASSLARYHVYSNQVHVYLLSISAGKLVVDSFSISIILFQFAIISQQQSSFEPSNSTVVSQKSEVCYCLKLKYHS